MMINLDVSATAFFMSGNLVEMVAKILNLKTPDDLRRSTAPLDWKKVEKMIKGLRITVTHRERSSRSFKIFGITNKAASDSRFSSRVDREDPQSKEIETDIVTYFKETYNMVLK